MLTRVQLKKKQVAPYAPLLGEETIHPLRQFAAPLRGLRVLRVNPTGEGGGGAELLASLVPLMRDLGLDAEWALICHDDPFFEVTKGFDSALQGKPLAFSPGQGERYLNRSRNCGGMIAEEKS